MYRYADGACVLAVVLLGLAVVLVLIYLHLQERDRKREEASNPYDFDHWGRLKSRPGEDEEDVEDR